MNTQAIIAANKRRARHKMSGSPEYKAWSDMKVRCLRPNHKSFRNYGARGIKICERWMRFDEFFADMGNRPEGCSLDRRDNNGDYEPGNCRWVTLDEQNRNKRNNHLIEFHGIILNICDWAEVFGLTADALSRRLKRGWPLERAMTHPALKRTYQSL